MNRRTHLSYFLILTLVGLVFLQLQAPESVAQTTSASLRGTVLDPKGAVVPDADVNINDAQIGISLSTKTDKNGVYQFKEVRPGKYTLTVTAAGFATLKQNGLELLMATPTTNDVTLQISTGVTTVEVTANIQTINTSGCHDRQCV